MIRPRLEYAAVVWSPNAKKDIRKLERIQRVATKMVPELRELTYKDRLKEMGLPTLQDRKGKRRSNNSKPDEDGGRNQTDERTLKDQKESVFKGHKKTQFSTYNCGHLERIKKEVVEATNIHKFKEMLAIWRSGDRTL